MKVVTATKKLAILRKRIRAIAGGTSASKTYSIIGLLIDYAQAEDGKVISIVSESMPHLRKGAMRDFLMIMQDHGYFKRDLWDKTNSTYNFESRSIIEFFSVDSWERVKGARRDVLFINEANHISYNAYTQMEVRTKEIIWLDWNPESEFWYYTEIKPVIDHDFVTLTYLDNDALDQRIIDSIESRRNNKNWWKVYGLGQLGEVEGRIFTGWEIIKEIPHEARLERYGLDFGYANDPSALVAIYYWNGGYIIDELLFRIKMANREIADLINTLPKALIVADSAEPKSIDEMKDDYRINIVGATKGQGSVTQGIQYVQDQKIFMTQRSVNLIKEYRNYLWETDKEGNIINEPQKFMNHTMDAVRYGFDKFQRAGVFRMNYDVGGVEPFLEGTLA